MGLIFNRDIARLYESWYHSPQGRAIDRSIEQLILNLLNPTAGQKILDIGCGTGNHLIIFNKFGLDLCGIDGSPYMIRKAKERLGHRCTLKTGMAEDLPFSDNEFDLAVFINTLEFLENPLQALKEAGRVASQKVFVGVINSLSWNGLVKNIQGYLGSPLFSRAKLFNFWETKSLLQSAYGRVPISWGCNKIRPAFLEEISPVTKDFSNWKHCPFAPFLGFSATMQYRVKADLLPLKVRLKKASRSFVGVRTFEDLNGIHTVHRDERGLSL
jgi:ubiquinone/menaquinone biosynthesis C-methylase UbiE